MAVVLHHSQLRGTAKLVLLGIANHQSDQGAWPSIATLARYAGCTERQVQRHIATAVGLGELVVHVQDGGTHRTRGDRRPNRYEVEVACPPECDGSANHRIAKPRGDTVVTPGAPVDNEPRGPRGDTDVIPSGNGVTLTAPRGDADVTRTIREPSTLLPSVSPETTDRATTRRTDGPEASDEPPAAAGPDGPPTDPRLADPGFLRFLAAAVPAVRRPERFTWPTGELDALEARWRSPDPFAAHHRQPVTSTPTPPKFDPTLHGPPPDAIPMPEHVRDALRRPAC